MTAWTDSSGNEYCYVLGGSPDGTAASATASVWMANVSNGQISAWAAAPPLPQPLTKPYAAVIGNWLIVAGGVNSAGTTVAATWYAQIGPGGVPGPWQAGPALPQSCYAFAPGWNLLVTDSAMIIVSGTATSGTSSEYAQVLAVSPDGPAPAWELQAYTLAAGYGEYQCAAYPSGPPGMWEAFGFGLTSYTFAPLMPVPLVSVPLPVSGLTPGAPYHLVFHQSGGDAVNNYLELGVMAAGPSSEILSSPSGSGGPWTAYTSVVLAVSVYDQTAAGQPWHLLEDSGARLTTLVNGAADGQLLGVAEATAFPPGSPANMLASVAQIEYDEAGLPSGTVVLT